MTRTTPDGVGIPAALDTAITALYAAPEDSSGGDAARQWAEHHRALIAGLEPAQWPVSSQGKSHLTIQDVIEIREAYASKQFAQVEIARAFSVSAGTVSLIVRGITHSDAGGPTTYTGKHARNRNWKRAS